MSTRPNLTREDWVAAAQSMLVKSGIDAVRVDTLAKELKITRGSFYYHFKNRNELLDEVLGKWRSKATEHVINSLRNAKVTSQEQLIRLLELPLHGHAAQEAAAIELAIRGWARRDSKARQAIDEVDRYRLGYIEDLLIKLGHTDDAKDRAYLIYSYQLSLSIIQSDASTEERLQRHERIARMLVPVQNKHSTAVA